MIKLINAYTGSVMLVHESRLQEYLAAGHKPAEEPKKPAQKTSKKRSQ